MTVGEGWRSGPTHGTWDKGIDMTTNPSGFDEVVGEIASTLGAPTATNRASDKFILRLPDGMREHLAGVAEREGRSMNAVVVTALAIYFVQEGTPLADRVKNELGDMRQAIERLTEEVAKLRRREK